MNLSDVEGKEERVRHVLYIDYWNVIHSLKVEIEIISNTQTRISQFMFYNKNVPKDC